MKSKSPPGRKLIRFDFPPSTSPEEIEAARPGGTEAGAKAFLDRAQKLNGGHHLGVQVSWAEGVLVQSQKREEFEAVLKAVVAADVDAVKKNRLANTIAQRRARLLLKYASDLFN